MVSTETSAVIPLRGILQSADDLARARQALGKEVWRTRLADEILSAADWWVARDDEWIRSMVPGQGSVFAYGMNGCPACGASWKRFGRDVCSWEHPGKATCPECNRVFPDPDPKSPYHDLGAGIHINGKHYFPVGVWNSFVVQELHAVFDETSCALNNLTHAYALTGRDEYARKAIVIMDALATLSPTTSGPRDFDYKGRLDTDWGRLHFLTSIVYRALVPLGRAYDLVGRHSMLLEDSPTSPGVTMADNIRIGLFEDYLFKHFDVRQARLSTLHNHEADSVRAMLVVGLLFDNADYIRWSMESFDQLLANTIDRDGMYYETSTGYTGFTRSVFVDMAELLAGYRPEKYADQPGNFPPTRNYFDDPKLIKLVIDNFDLSIAGHAMNFGNDHVDRNVYEAPVGEWRPADWIGLAKLGACSSDEKLRSRARQMIAAHLYGREDMQGQSKWLKWWMLKLPEPVPAAPETPLELSPVGSGKFFSTKAIAAFQSGEWPNRRGFLVRGGPNLPHAQDDLLGLNLWDVGRELAAELGYGTFDSHLHKGWSTRAISHNLVTVDEDAALNGNEYFKKSPGASFRSFYDGGSVKFMDADGKAQFEGRLPVSTYRRRIAMVDVDSSHTYYIDLFDVAGGSTRDYSFHAPYNDELLTDALTLEGVQVEPQEGAWTLAGLNPEWRNAPWNAPGLSWGERVSSGEYIRKVSPDDGVGPYGWVAPGRGYGFLYNLRGGKASTPFSATWKFEGSDNASMRATFLPTSPVMTYTANAPDLSGKHLFNYVVVRDSGTSQSRFAVVLEPCRQERSVRRIELVNTSTTGPAVVRVELKDGRIDYILFNETDAGVLDISIGRTGALRHDGEFGFVRLDPEGLPAEAHLFRGRTLDAAGRNLLKSQPAVAGTVVSAGGEEVQVKLEDSASAPLVADARLAVFSSPHYTRSTTIQLEPPDIVDWSGELVTLRTGSVTLQRVRVEGTTKDGITTSVLPLPLTFLHERPTRFLDGKALVGRDGAVRGRIERFTDIKSFVATPGSVFQSGDDLEVADFIAGDAVELPLGACWKADKH